MVNGSDASFMFGDNVLVVNLNIMPAGKLQRQSHILKYNRTQEDQDRGIINFLNMNSNENLDDIVTKSHAFNICPLLMKPILF